MYTCSYITTCYRVVTELLFSPRREFSEKSGERGTSGITVLIPHLKIDAPMSKNDSEDLDASMYAKIPLLGR